MVIGNGLIASAFATYFSGDPNIILFASGVSNSKETRREVFLREQDLLFSALTQKRFLVYFSTCSINDPELSETPYVVHKKEMEHLVREFKDCVIFRLPQVVGKTSNPNTLTNYLHKQISSGNDFKIWRHAKRNLIDVADVASIVTHLIRTHTADGQTLNVACSFSVSIYHLVSIFESISGKKANYEFVEAGDAYPIDASLAAVAASQLGISFDESYIERLIRKYYGA